MSISKGKNDNYGLGVSTCCIQVDPIIENVLSEEGHSFETNFGIRVCFNGREFRHYGLEGFEEALKLMEDRQRLYELFKIEELLTANLKAAL